MKTIYTEHSDFLTKEELKGWAKDCYAIRSYVEGLEPDPEWGENSYMLASRHRSYDIFQVFEFMPLLKKIKEYLPEEVLNSGYCIHGFINWQESFQSLGKHSHDSYMTGHVTIQGDSGATCYEDQGDVFKTSVTPGSLYLIGHEVPHWVEENLSVLDRISIAFSIRKEGEEERPTTKI